MKKDLHESFKQLVRLGIGHQAGATSNDIEWHATEALAERQGLLALVLDGIERLPNNQRPPHEILLKWIGIILREYEQRYELYCKAISELASFYNKHGYKMMVLKGYACSLDWPKPEHRPCGDIDIWLFGQQKEADEVLEAWFKSSKCSKVQKYEIDTSHHHHTVFEWSGFTVENHYDFINVHHHKSHVALENIFKELGNDASHRIEVLGEQVYLPSPNLHALFLIKHAVLHFCSTELTIRQLLDWAFFVEKHGKDVDWNWLKGLLDEHGMLSFFNIVNAICVEDLGFDINLFPSVQFVPSQKDRVLKEILEPNYTRQEPQRVVSRVIYKFKRWKGNAWKHELCYKESMWSAFWSGVRSHLLKPSSI